MEAMLGVGQALILNSTVVDDNVMSFPSACQWRNKNVIQVLSISFSCNTNPGYKVLSSHLQQPLIPPCKSSSSSL